MQDILKIRNTGMEIQGWQHIIDGFPINYFEKINELQIGDEIVYKTSFGTKNFEIVSSNIIDEIDWSYLQETEEPKITLITCVKNRPNKRLCIQAIEKN